MIFLVLLVVYLFLP